MKRLGYTILFISEGESDKLLSVELQNNGFSILEASDGNESISSCKLRTPHLILIDIKTKDFAVNILKSLRAETDLSYVPKILISSISDMKTKIEIFGLGINDYLVRPYDYDELLARINSHLINSLYISKVVKDSERMKENSLVDEVTDLLNKKYLMNRLIGEVSRAVRRGECLSFVLIEADNYDNIIQLYGDAAKNYVLKQVSVIIKQLIRLSDVLVRYDDNKLGVLCPITDRNGLDSFSDRLLQMMHESVFEYNGEIIKFSIKVGAYTLESSDFNSLEKKVTNIIEFAEEALERAVTSSGDRVEFYE